MAARTRVGTMKVRDDMNPKASSTRSIANVEGRGVSTSRPSRRAMIGGGLAIAGAAAAGSLATRLLSTDRTGEAAVGQPATDASALESQAAQPVYLGYRRADYAKPYAKYFTETMSPVQGHVSEAVLKPPTPMNDIPPLADLATEINSAGYSKVETGYSFMGPGASWSATLTKMPGVTPEMWDWWFGWHSLESARYKLWHPEAHLHAGLLNPLADEPGLSDKEKYVGNTSYVDEYLPDYHGGRQYLGDNWGGFLVGPGITFVDPAEIGIDLSKFDGTAIVGRGGIQGAADTTTLFVHQVRRVDGGSEMRSRFYVNCAPAQGVRPVDARAAADAKARAALPSQFNMQGFFNMLHAGQENNHLAGFLPALYEEFRPK